MAAEGGQLSYCVSQCPDAALLLKWAESQGNRELTQAEVQSCKERLCLDGGRPSVSVCLALVAGATHGRWRQITTTMRR